MWDNFKWLLSDDAAYYSLIICLVAGASFGLGRLSVTENKAISAVSTKDLTATVVGSNQLTEKKEVEVIAASTTKIESSTAAVLYVGSKNSDKYHLPWCSGAQRIAEANKVFFKSKAEAEAAGYTPAANCKGI